MRSALSLAVTLVAAAVVSAACGGDSDEGSGGIVAPSVATPTTSETTTPSTSATTTSPTTTPAPSRTSRTTPVPTELRVVARDLDVPWGLAFLPDGSALLTTRDEAGLVQVREGARPVRLGTVRGVEPGGEGGLLGIAVSPDFATDASIFVYYTASQDNRVVRMTFEGGRARDPVPIVTGIPKAGNHNGGRLAFGPDGYLYVTTGDASDGSNSQDRGSLGGKILRITKDGKAAPGNPFQSRVWTWGHRNVQGIAWDSDGAMYASEFGQNTWDELNLIKPGLNYGWPEVEGKAGVRGFTDPLAQWATSDASPSGIAIADGAVYMAALRGESLWRIPVDGADAGTPRRLLAGEYGRLRDVVTGPDGRLWVLTSNTYRGNPRADDDKVLVFPVSLLR
jgi:glucose/arabinose dehydrogenase